MIEDINPTTQIDIYYSRLNAQQLRIWLAAAEARGAEDEGHVLTWARAGLRRLDNDPDGEAKAWRPSVVNWNRLHELSGL